MYDTTRLASQTTASGPASSSAARAASSPASERFLSALAARRRRQRAKSAASTGLPGSPYQLAPAAASTRAGEPDASSCASSTAPIDSGSSPDRPLNMSHIASSPLGRGSLHLGGVRCGRDGEEGGRPREEASRERLRLQLTVPEGPSPSLPVGCFGKKLEPNRWLGTRFATPASEASQASFGSLGPDWAHAERDEVP